MLIHNTTYNVYLLPLIMPYCFLPFLLHSLQSFDLFSFSALPIHASDISLSILSSAELHCPQTHSNHPLAILPSSLLNIPTAKSSSSGLFSHQYDTDAPHLPQKLLHTSGDDQWCFSVCSGFASGLQARRPNVTGKGLFSLLTSEGPSMAAGVLALKTCEGKTSVHGVKDTPKERRQERHAQK